MKKLFLYSIGGLLLFAFTQKAIDPHNLVGLWKMDKHTYIIKEMVKGKDKDVEHECDFGIHLPMLQISKDSTYSIKLKGKVIEMGKWTFRGTSTLKFYDCKDMPDDPAVTIDPREMEVLKASSSELRLKEYQCSQKFIGTSVYKKL
ncbi:MAG: hypothetical protein IT233_05490 [Bacteroidia bacterium]|nr:hypothetical protein [Bacteroidia bacterium]